MRLFLVGSVNSRHRTKGKDSGVLFAKAVNELRSLVAVSVHLEMLMWGESVD